jgi:DNA mismatch repair protein MutL
MPIIKILPPDLRNKIAAGEVIERPASVVKELIENSIDAESTSIRIDILNGGKKLISVSDNGIGMDREDALLCFERHATSKLKSEKDLFNIKTMGFRGEALPSIASVSKVTLITGLKDAPGISISVHGGEIREIKDSPSAGTSMEIRDLFFNTPARRKFLKSTGTEVFHIIDTVTREALSHPETGFLLNCDNQEVMNLPAASCIRERILQLYGSEFLDGLVEATHSEDSSSASLRESWKESETTLSAFVSNTATFRNSRAHQFIFINKRPVKDTSISHAVYRAYEGILPHEKHPVFFLFLGIDPEKVDFNVHPAKREIRFADKESVYQLVLGNLREAIRKERDAYVKPFAESPETIQAPTSMYGITEAVVSASSDSIVSENLELAYKPLLPSLYLGDTFFAVSGKGGLTLIDHHAAHERILYERLLTGMASQSSRLLFPRQVRLSSREYKAILENTTILREFGIEADDFGHDTVLIRSLPEALNEADIRGILSDIASCIIKGIPPDKSLRESLAARIACHSSVRGSRVLNQEEIANLLEDLEQTRHPDQCPHGRPTRIFLSLDALKKMFRRK